MEFIKNQNWRYATKKFDAGKKVSPENIELIKQAIQLSVSSYGLQLYKVLIVESQSLREKLRPVSWDQSQITDASHLFVFCNYAEVKPSHIDSYLDLAVKVRNIRPEQLNGYGDFMKSKVGGLSESEQFNWTRRQTYIALANLLSACAELAIDACPMEGFEPDQYNSILNLTEKGLNAAVVAAVGYRSQDDATQHLQKIRKPMDLLFEMI